MTYRLDDIFLSDDILGDLLKNTREYRRLTKEETNDLVARSNFGDKEALDLLVKSNIRLIVSVARQYSKRISNMELVDLVQEGIIGFMRAIQKYDPSLGQLSTYAVYWIEQAVSRAIQDKEDSIRKANKFVEYSNRYYRIKDDCAKKGIPMVGDEEICRLLGISKETLHLIKSSSNLMTVSINEPTEDEKSELGNFIASPNEAYDDIVKDYDNQRFLAVIKEILSKSQYYIVYHHIINPERTLDSISEDIGISVERASQLEKKAFRIIKPYILENSILFSNVIANFKREKINVNDINVLPISPIDIIKYLYIEKELTQEERKVLYLQLFGKLKYDRKIASQCVGCSIDELIKIEERLTEKIKAKFCDVERFKTYLNVMLQTYKTRIFELIGESVDYKIDESTLSYDEVKDLINKADVKINKKDEELLLRYFNVTKNGGSSSYDIEKDIYLTVFGIKQESFIPLTKLYETFMNNLDEFTDEQILFLKCFIFHKKDTKLFYEEYSDSHLITNYKFLMTKLEILYFGINKLFGNGMNKDKYLIVKKKYFKKLGQRRIEVLDLYYGVDKERLTPKEIALLLNEDVRKIHGEIYSAIDYLDSLYNHNFKERSINFKTYLPFLLDRKYTFSDDIRKVLQLYLREELSYEEIAQTLNLSRSKVTNLIDEGLRRIDFYRFGIVKPTKIELVDLEKFFAEVSNFNYIEQKIIIAKKYDLKTYEEISLEYNISKSKIDHLINRFNAFYQHFLVREVTLSDEDIMKEINYSELESVLDIVDKKIISLLYGYKNVYNMEGLKLNQKEIAKHIGYSESAIGDRVKLALNNIKARRMGLLKPELLYIDRGSMEELITDNHLPISKEKRDIICYLYGLDQHKELKLEEIAILMHSNVKNIKRMYQRAIVDIFKYLNKEINGRLDYEQDIEPNLVYFSKKEVLMILESFKNNLTNEEIANKYHLSINVVNKTIQRIKSRLASIINGDDKRFDFDFYRNFSSQRELPYYGNLELVKNCFDLYVGESTLENLSILDIKEKLNIACSDESIRRHMMLFVLSFYKYQYGIRKHITFSYEEIEEYYNQFKDTLVFTIKEDYIRYLTKTNSRSEFTSSDDNISDTIMFDLLKYRNPDFFNVDEVSKEEVADLVNEYYDKLNPRVRDTLIVKFGLKARDFMKEREIQAAARLVRKLEKNTVV